MAEEPTNAPPATLFYKQVNYKRMFREKNRVINNVDYDQAPEASARYADISARLGFLEAQLNVRITSI